MKLQDIMEHLSSNPIETGNMSRRQTLTAFSELGKKFAMASVPAALLAAIPSVSKAGIAGANDVISTLNFALTLEYLEKEYYQLGVASGVIAGSDLAIFQQISKHETAHVTLLQNTISQLGGSPISKPTFDFTASGQFAPFVVYAQFLALSQAFEDTGVRAYKGKAGNLMGNNDVLTAALQIHSVEARHAAEVRKLRGDKGWITGSSYGTLPSVTAAIYAGEDNTTQGGVNVTTLTTVGNDAVTEAFDEPLSDTDVLAIASLFIV